MIHISSIGEKETTNARYLSLSDNNAPKSHDMYTCSLHMFPFRSKTPVMMPRFMQPDPTHCVVFVFYKASVIAVRQHS